MPVTTRIPTRCLLPALLLSCENIEPPPLPQPRACSAPQDCKGEAAGICDPVSYTCRACRPIEDDARCRERSAATPRCGAAGACVACARSADCESQVCQEDGTCADPKGIVYVDNRGGACDTGRAHAGSAADPHCDVQAGVDAARAGGKPVVRIAPSTAPYGAVTIGATPPGGLTLLGADAGDGAAPPVLLRADPPALTVTGGAGRVAVTAVGLDLSSKGADGVRCDQQAGASPPELTIRRSALFQAQGAGLAAVKCKLVLDAVRVHENGQGGLRLSGSTYALSNLMVHGNSRGPGVALLDVPQGGAGSSLRFSTIAYNFYVGQPAGIDCGGAQLPIESSIVVHNFGAASQLRGCRLTQVVVGADAAPGGIMMAPEFVRAADPLDLHLQSSQANRACCIDKVPAAPGLPAQDIDGRRRPQGSAWDIGAHEVAF